MIIHDLDIKSIMTTPDKTNPVLIVNPNTVLPIPIAMQLLQPVSGRDPQVFQLRCSIK